MKLFLYKNIKNKLDITEYRLLPDTKLNRNTVFFNPNIVYPIDFFVAYYLQKENQFYVCVDMIAVKDSIAIKRYFGNLFKICCTNAEYIKQIELSIKNNDFRFLNEFGFDLTVKSLE